VVGKATAVADLRGRVTGVLGFPYQARLSPSPDTIHGEQGSDTRMDSERLDVGVYYFPGYHSDPRTSAWHGKDWTEWRLAEAARPRFPGHEQPKVPLWGYEDESDPAVMERKATTAADHGVTHFIFDWYWYEGRPFLNGALDRGFLSPQATHPLRFSLMWANHDWRNIHPARLDGSNPVLLTGATDRRAFADLCDHVVNRYFRSPRYLLIAGRPYFSIYDIPCFVKGMGGAAEARRAIDDLRDAARRVGLPGVHVNLVHSRGGVIAGSMDMKSLVNAVGELTADSVTSYVWVHHFGDFTFPATEYGRVHEHAVAYWQEMSDACPVPYYPNVTMGWDSTPRTILTDAFEDRGYPYMSTFRNNTPEAFGRAITDARHHLQAQGLAPALLTINAWNEWTEGSYLEPDSVSRYGYLEALKRAVAG
jgi:hypothetical protein